MRVLFPCAVLGVTLLAAASAAAQPYRGDPGPGDDPAGLAAPPADQYGPDYQPDYQYVYEPDRILVVDPRTGIAIQALPR